MNELEARKRALVAESEIYRQTLKLEFQNLRLYGAGLQRKFAAFRLLQPLLMLAAPFARGSFRKRGFSKFRLVTKAIWAWQLYRRIAPVLQRLRSKRTYRQGPYGPAAEERTSATDS
jgi:hypothetical protein